MYSRLPCIQASAITRNHVAYLLVNCNPQKKTNSNCCSASLLLFIASCYLHSPSTASARYWRSACIDTDMLRQWLVATWVEFQHSEVYCATGQCRKRLEACINAEGGHSEHLLWLLAWHSSWHTSKPVLFRSTDDNPQLALFRAFNVWTSVRWKSFAFHKLVWWHLQVGWAVCVLLR